MKNITFLLLFLIQTVCTYAQNPGGISTNLDLWLKADAGVTGANPITSWSDQSGMTSHPVINGNPSLQNGNFNYNPTINLDGTGDFFSWTNLATTYTQAEILIVYNIPTATPTVIREIWDFDNNRNTGSSNPYTNNNFYDDFGSNFSVTVIGNAFLSYVDVTKQYIHNSCSNSTSYENYMQGGLTATNGPASGFGTNTTIGTGDWSGGSSPLIADMAEIILFDRKLLASERIKVWSYLAVKYGITLDNTAGGTIGDYQATDGSLIWDASDNSAYHNNVIGVGRDTDEVLLQKQSRTLDDTTHLYVGTLQAENQLNTGTISSNISYALIGDNQGRLCTTASSIVEMPIGCGLYSRLEREWKVTKTNITDNLNIDIILNSCANPTLVNDSELRLLVDDDGDFSNGGTTCYFNGDGTGVVISYSNPVITVSGISTTHIANNSTKYITIASILSTTPLPVEITTFDAICNDETPVLTWTTASEINNDYFTVERSSDAIHFEIIGKVDGTGNSNSTKEYRFIDNNSLSKTAYYRLKQTDFNGDYGYHGIVSVSCKQGGNVSIYPNPFTNSITVQLSEDVSYPLTVEVLDYLGRKVHYATIETSATEIVLDQELSTGTYFVKVFNESIQVIERIVKMK